MLFLDLDNFKLVNDSLGHHAGDMLLAQLGERLQGCTRETDMVARQGGDEFLLLLSDLERGARPGPGTEAAMIVAESVAERVHEALQEPFDLNGTEFIASGSIGISLFPQDALDAETLLKNADTAMYQSKKHEPGGYVIFATSGEDPMKKLSHDHPPAPGRGAGELDPALPAGRGPARRLRAKGWRRSFAGRTRTAASCRPGSSSRSPRSSG